MSAFQPTCKQWSEQAKPANGTAQQVTAANVPFTIRKIMASKHKSLVLVHVVLLVLTGGRFSSANAQVLGTNYAWSDSITVGTSGRDSTFSRVWEEVNIKAVGGDAWIRYGAPDTSSWSSRKWYRIVSGESISFGPGTKLRRLQFKANASTVTFYFAGYKKRWQVGTGH